MKKNRSQHIIRDTLKNFEGNLIQLLILLAPKVEQKSFWKDYTLSILKNRQLLQESPSYLKLWFFQSFLTRLSKYSAHERFDEHSESIPNWFLSLDFEDQAFLTLKSIKPNLTNFELGAIFFQNPDSLDLHLNQILKTLDLTQEEVSQSFSSILSQNSNSFQTQNTRTLSSRIGFQRRRFFRAPKWLLQLSLEGGAFAILLGFTLWSLPKIQKIIDRKNETQISSFQLMSILQEADILQNTPSELKEKNRQIAQSDENKSPISSESKTSFGEDLLLASGEIRGPEVWRFHFKTQNPKKLQSEIAFILGKSETSSAQIKRTPSSLDQNFTQGVPVPGGIQFQVLVPSKEAPEIQKKLTQTIYQTQNKDSKPMSWFRTPAKEPLPHGKTKLIIWITQN